VTVPVDPIAIAFAVARAFDALGIIHTIGGAIASSIAGEPRSTLDIDVVAALGESDVPPLVAALSADFYVDDQALQRAVRERSSANVIHQATQLKVDIFVAGGTPHRLTSEGLCLAVVRTIWASDWWSGSKTTRPAGADRVTTCVGSLELGTLRDPQG
jgi:DNA-binding transcriptional LysR family regulator